jgi:hypothetical protein
MLVSTYQTSQNSDLDTYCHENLTSHKYESVWNKHLEWKYINNKSFKQCIRLYVKVILVSHKKTEHTEILA